MQYTKFLYDKQNSFVYPTPGFARDFREKVKDATAHKGHFIRILQKLCEILPKFVLFFFTWVTLKLETWKLTYTCTLYVYHWVRLHGVNNPILSRISAITQLRTATYTWKKGDLLPLPTWPHHLQPQPWTSTSTLTTPRATSVLRSTRTCMISRFISKYLETHTMCEGKTGL